MGHLLSDKVALVIDGTGYVGCGIVQAFLKEDATVIVPALSEKQLDILKIRLENVSQEKLITFLSDTGDYDKVSEFAGMLVERFGKVDLAVTYVTNTCATRCLLETDLQEWHAVEDNLTAYFVTSRALLMLMQDSCSMYLTISNADQLERDNHSSFQNLISVLQMQMAGLFAQEKEHIKARYHHLYINDESEPNGQYSTDLPVPSDDVGKYIIRLYLGEVRDPGKVFQFCMNKPFNSQLFSSLLRD
jgi:NAD(P)-dependent dehydrogenase (short-subunit alcohol dehydrogenase family)